MQIVTSHMGAKTQQQNVADLSVHCFLLLFITSGNPLQVINMAEYILRNGVGTLLRKLTRVHTTKKNKQKKKRNKRETNIVKQTFDTKLF